MYTIRDLCRASELSRSAILYYDSMGLLKPVERSASNYRLYSDESLKILKKICLYREAGVSIGDISALLHISENDDKNTVVLENTLARINSHMRDLHKKQIKIIEIIKAFNRRNCIGETGLIYDNLVKQLYMVKETGPVYYTNEMEKTVKWFKDILGWHYEIDERNPEGKGIYGCVYYLPSDFDMKHVAPLTGIHLFYGEPKRDVVALMQVEEIDAIHKHAIDRGWKDISDIRTQPWGTKTCTISTPDGYVLMFFE